MQKNDDIPRGQLSTIILKTLLDNDKYGYEIINNVAELTNGKIAIKQPSLYSCLRRMEEQSLISSYWRDSSLGGRRHYYRITDYGKKYVEKWNVDILSPSQDEKTEIEENKPTFLEQGNLFQTDAKKVNQEIEQPNSEVDNSFVQYDLFSQTTFIAKPSVDVFETIKDKQQQDDNSLPQSSPFNFQEDRISKLRNTIIENSTTNIELEPVNIKQEFMLLKKKQKSFTESYKDKINNDDGKILDNEPELTLKEPTLSFDDSIQLPSEIENNDIPSQSIEIQENSSFALAEDLNVQINENESYNLQENEQSQEPVFVNLDDELPTIFKSTTEFIDNSYIQLQPIEESPTDNQIKDIEHEPQEIINNSIEIKNTFDNDSDKNIDILQQELQNSSNKKDDGVFITEKPDMEKAPKVKKIAPNRFEHFNTYNQIENKIDILYKAKFEKKSDSLEETPAENNETNPEPENQQPNVNDNIINYTNFEQLSLYYKQNGVSFSTYKKLPKSLKTHNSTYVKANKFNMLTSATMFILILIQTLTIGIICSQKQPNLWFLYLLAPIFVGLIMTYYAILFFRNRTRLIVKTALRDYNFITNIIVSLIAILMIFSINLICGMSYSNLMQYSTSFLYLSVLTLNLPLFSFTKYLILQLKIADA